MYSGKSVRPKIEPSRTLALTEDSCEDFLSRTTWRIVIFNEKRRNKAKYLSWHFIRLGFVKKTSILTLSKCLDISSAVANATPELLKSIPFLSDATVRRSAFDRENLVVFSYTGSSNNLENNILSDKDWRVYKVCESSQFFITINWIKSGPNAFDCSSYFMTFFSNLGVK